MTNKIVYFDNNATTVVDKEVLDAMLPYFSIFYGNASSKLHAYGWQAEAAVELAKEEIASFIHASPNEIIFTSGATESVNMALKGIFLNPECKKKHLITTATEHKAVLDVCEWLERYCGVTITYLPVNPEGEIDIEDLKNAISENTAMVAIMAANNETGVLNPIEEINTLCKKSNVLFFCDATQYLGKYLFDCQECGVDLMAFSAHKMHGPKGIGALFVKNQTAADKLQSIIHGGSHQQGYRSGTLNVPAIVGFGKACKIARRDYWENSAHISRLKNQFEHRLLDMEGLRINGSTRNRLYNTSNIQFPFLPDLKKWTSKIAFSSGSACSSSNGETSHVLKAMGLRENEIKQSFRFSFSKFNTESEVEFTLELMLKNK